MRSALPCVAATCTALLGLPAPAPAGVVTVGSGVSVDVGTSFVDLACSNLFVEGTFDLGSGTVEQALDVTISFGGTLNGETGALNHPQQQTSTRHDFANRRPCLSAG